MLGRLSAWRLKSGTSIFLHTGSSSQSKRKRCRGCPASSISRTRPRKSSGASFSGIPMGPSSATPMAVAWTTHAANCAFVALQIRIGLQAMKAEGFTLSDEEIQRKIATLKADRKAKGRAVRKTAVELREESKRKLRNSATCAKGEEALPYCVSSFVLPSVVEIRGRCFDGFGFDGACRPDYDCQSLFPPLPGTQYLRDALRKAAGWECAP